MYAMLRCCRHCSSSSSLSCVTAGLVLDKDICRKKRGKLWYYADAWMARPILSHSPAAKTWRRQRPNGQKPRKEARTRTQDQFRPDCLGDTSAVLKLRDPTSQKPAVVSNSNVEHQLKTTSISEMDVWPYMPKLNNVVFQMVENRPTRNMYCLPLWSSRQAVSPFK